MNKEEEFDEKKFEEAFEKAYDKKQEEFEKIRKEKLIISLIGSVNSGKSSIINALTGIKYAEVKPRAGSTSEVSLYKLKEKVYIADTPGLFDIDESVSEKASEFVENDADIILFFINAAVGITKQTKDSFLDVQKLDKEIIVVLNKIDTLEPDEVLEVVEQSKEELGVVPFPVSAKSGTGIEKLSNEVVRVLETKGKELLFLKASKFKENEVKKWINGATAAAAGIGALPIPGSDIVPLTGLQIGLAMKIAFIYGFTPSKSDVMKLIGSTVTGSIGKSIVRWGITAIKAAGWIPGAQLAELAIMGIASAVAASLTYGFGWACNAYYKSGMNIDLGDLGEIFQSFYEKYKNSESGVLKSD